MQNDEKVGVHLTDILVFDGTYLEIDQNGAVELLVVEDQVDVVVFVVDDYRVLACLEGETLAECCCQSL